MGDWFKLVFGVPEPDFDQVKNHFKINEKSGETELSINDKKWMLGPFSTPRLDQLRERHNPNEGNNDQSKMRVQIIRGDVQNLHIKPENNYATFQVASQFNALEMIGPGGSPEHGITNYARDRTQGPACCLCSAPAILIRNYFTNQTTEKQLNLLYDAQSYLDSDHKFQNSEIRSDNSVDIYKNEVVLPPTDSPSNHCRYFDILSGYTISNQEKLSKIPESKISCDEFKSKIRIAIHEDIPVTATNWGKNIIKETDNKYLPKVTHVLSAAAAVSYNRGNDSAWKPLASSILSASYESTILAAFENKVRNFEKDDGKGSKRVFLTFVGGGVFGNRSDWINNAIAEACLKYFYFDLNVFLVSYGNPDARLMGFVTDLNKKIGKLKR